MLELFEQDLIGMAGKSGLKEFTVIPPMVSQKVSSRPKKHPTTAPWEKIMQLNQCVNLEHDKVTLPLVLRDVPPRRNMPYKGPLEAP